MIINRYSNRTIRGFVSRYLGLHKKKTINSTYEEKYKEDLKNRIFQGNQTYMFETVQIETINRCNGECPFCPVNIKEDTRKLARMTDDLFKKIIDELSHIEYRGRIGLFSNNEPLIDDKLEERAEYTKKMCPYAEVYIFTNGKLLNVDRLRKLEPWLDRIVIDNYNDKLSINENIKPIVDICRSNPILDQKVEIHLRKINEVLYTRGGQSPNNDKKIVRDYSCFLPFTQLVIRPDGKVSLCCNDALGKMTLGDVNINSLMDIWESERFKDIRKKIIALDYDELLCKYCDSKHYN